MDSPIPYRYKSVSRSEMELRNRLFQKDPGLTFTLGSDSFGVHFEPHGPNRPLASPLAAQVRVDDRIRFQLCPEEQVLAMMLADIASVEVLKTLSEELRGVAMEAALEKVLDRIDQFSGTKSTIHRIDPNPNQGRTDLFFSLTRKKDGCRGRGVIQTDTDGLAWIAALLGRLSAKSMRPLHHIPVCGRIEIGCAMLTVAEINDLRPMDIVLAGKAGAWEEREVGIHFSQGLALAGNLVQPDTILVQDLITGKKETEKMTEQKASAAARSEVPMDDIPVKLVFEIGRTDMAMGELCRLQPGYTIKLQEQVDIKKPVTIKANGVPVGNGEMVLIDDQSVLGVRILDFNNEISPPESG